ncbi:MAG: pyrimidine dimer DNA glycosylase/endonuclease V [Candidatus Aenigmatarchaeota archaeon]
MTRMWMVDPELLCRQHLLGEHNELHKLVGHIEKGNTEVVRGHAEKGQVDTSRIKERHKELAREMEGRGFDHDTPLDYGDELDLGSVDLEKNLEDLKNRCEKCSERIRKHSKN